MIWSLEDVSFRQGTRTLAEGVTLDIAPGETWAVAGPNGAGKSTFLHVLAGLHPAASGRVLFAGRPLARYSSLELARRRALMVQSTPEDIPLSVFEVAALGLAPHNGGAFLSREEKGQVAEVLEEVGMRQAANAPYAALSGGEKRRVLLARALLQSHEVLLLDEPTAAFDPAQVLHFHRLLQELAARRNTTVVMVTHLVDTLPHFSHVLLLGGGRWTAGPCLETLQTCGREFLGVDLIFGRAPDASITVVAREHGKAREDAP